MAKNLQINNPNFGKSAGIDRIPMNTEYALPPTTQQEEFSRAFVTAIATAAGYSVERCSVDMNSIDFSIRQRSNGDNVPNFDALEVQLKCTYSHLPKNGYLSLPIDIPTYNRLRHIRVATPKILVAVHVPRDFDRWLIHGQDDMNLSHCAYWISLKGKPEVSNSDSISIEIPTSQKLTIDALRALMNKIARGDAL